MDRIDLSTVPSAMEDIARSWSACPSPSTPRIAPRKTLPTALEPAAKRYRSIPYVDRTNRGQAIVSDAGFVDQISYDEARARADAIKAIARDIPDPKQYARYMPADEAAALLGAERGCGGWRFRADVPAHVYQRMQAVGLAYLSDNRNLPIFSQAVRRALLEDDR